MSGADEEHPSKRVKIPKMSNALPIRGTIPNFSDPLSQVTFLIGPDAVKFQVHKEFICHYSPVLRAAFNSPFIEGTTQTYTIDDTTPGAFRFLVQWIYQQSLDIGQLLPQPLQDARTLSNPLWESAEEQSLLELWVLADKFCVPQLQNVAIHTIVTLSNRLFRALGPQRFPYIYENTSDGSPLRRFVVDLCYHLPPESFVNHIDLFPRRLLAEYAVMTQKIRFLGDKQPPSNRAASNYYVNVPAEDN